MEKKEPPVAQEEQPKESPALNAPSRFSEPEKIAILLHEYDALKAEINGRTRDGFQLCSIIGALYLGAVGLLYSHVALWWFIIIAAGGAITLAWGTRQTFYWIGRAAKRLLEIEGQVKDSVGPGLLVWETRVTEELKPNPFLAFWGLRRK